MTANFLMGEFAGDDLEYVVSFREAGDMHEVVIGLTAFQARGCRRDAKILKECSLPLTSVRRVDNAERCGLD